MNSKICMVRRAVAMVGLIGLMTGAMPTLGAEKKPLELFGVTLKGATREQLRKAFKQNGMQVTREDNAYWVDVYDSKAVLDGASEFNAGYVNATGVFAFARYTFPGFMDTELVERVISMVQSKYGKLTSQSGNSGLGGVNARWNLGQGMQIEVSRGWPDTTTYLQFTDVAANSQMNNEINAEKKAQESQKNKSQSKAF